MLFMVIEHFDQGRIKDVYARFAEKGRMMPEGLGYVSSWITADYGRCFQIMECDDITQLQEWVMQWGDVVRFEIVPISPSADTTAAIKKYL